MWPPVYVHDRYSTSVFAARSTSLTLETRPIRSRYGGKLHHSRCLLLCRLYTPVANRVMHDRYGIFYSTSQVFAATCDLRQDESDIEIQVQTTQKAYVYCYSALLLSRAVDIQYHYVTLICCLSSHRFACTCFNSQGTVGTLP